MPGVSKLTWVTEKTGLDFYYKESQRACRDCDAEVTSFKAVNQRCVSLTFPSPSPPDADADADDSDLTFHPYLFESDRIALVCKSISDLVLISVEKKRIYEVAEFLEIQQAHTLTMRDRLAHLVEEVKEAIDQVKETFAKDSEEVQKEWVKFTQKVDRRVEDALRFSVKRSLQEFSRLLNGDNKSHEVTPLFHITLVLSQNHVHLSPDVDTLLDLVHRISRHLIAVTQSVPRLSLQMTEKQARDLSESGQPPIRPQLSMYEAISGDEEAVLKTVMTITSGVTAVVDKVTAYTSYWEKEYKSIWEVDKEAYIRRYEKAQKPLTSFEADISRYL